MWKIALPAIVLLLSIESKAQTYIELERAAFFGSKSVSIGHRVSRWNFSVGVGDISVNEFEQFNFKTRFDSTVIGINEFEIRPLNIGAAALYTTDPKFTLNNRADYPESGYYDFNSLRFALTYQFEVIYKRWSVFYDVTWLDQGILIEYNNGDGLGFENFLSSGFGVKYFF